MIEVKNLSKVYRRTIRKNSGLLGGVKNLIFAEYEEKCAVKNISFKVNEGELVGYIGPNGAGKSTSIKMLTGILVPTSGTIKVNGIVPYKNRKQYTQKIGTVFGQKTQLWWDVPVIESYKLLRDIYKVKKIDFEKNLEFFSYLLALDEFINVPVRQLSLGQRMRADLAAALLHDPKILFLDEPTIGVDIVTKERLRNFIKKINQEKKVTIFLTTHDMRDIEKLCSRMMIIDYGEIIYDGSVEKIRSKFGTYRTLVVEFEKEIPDFEISNAVLVKSEERRKWYKFNRSQTTPSDLLWQIEKRYPIVDLTIEEPEIEEMLRSIYEQKEKQIIQLN